MSSKFRIGENTKNSKFWLTILVLKYNEHISIVSTGHKPNVSTLKDERINVVNKLFSSSTDTKLKRGWKSDGEREREREREKGSKRW